MATPKGNSQNRGLFVGDGQLAHVCRQRNWAQTPLGSIAGWPEALRSTANLVLNSRLPMTLAWGPQFVQIYNDGYVPILGEKHPEALGRTVRETYPEAWSTIDPLLMEVWDTGTAIWRENMRFVLTRDGRLQETYFTFSYSPVHDHQGNVAGVLSAAVETTHEVVERRRSAVRHRLDGVRGNSIAGFLKQTLACLKEASADLPFCLLCRLYPDARTLDIMADTAAEQERVFDVENVAAQIPWERLQDLSSIIDLQLGPFAQLELTDDQQARLGGVTLLPISRGSDHSRRCVYAVVAGISEYVPLKESFRQFLADIQQLIRRNAEDLRHRELRVAEAENRYRAVFDHAPDAMFLTAPDGTILAANPAACELFGYSEDEIRQVGRDDVLDGEDPRVGHILAQKKAHGSVRAQVNCVHRDGTRIPCEVSSNVYLDARGNERTSVVLRDIRARLELEADLRQAQKLDVVGKLAGSIAHDFNNLLTAIHGAAQMLELQVEAGSEAAEDLLVVNEACSRAADLTRRLLAFTRRQPVRARHLHLPAVVHELDRMVRPLIGNNIEMVSAAPGDLWTVYADRLGIEQVLLNLVVNARDAMPAGGELTIEMTNADVTDARTCVLGRAMPPGPYVQMTVTDTGAGIEADDVAEIFEPFFTTKPEGTGLGLATVASVVVDARGHIFVDSSPGNGTRFSIFLPASEASAPHVPVLTTSPADGKLPAGRILLVEDHPLVRKSTVRMLADAGLQVSAASGGAEALALLADSAPDAFEVVICDVIMPQMNGEELVRRIQQTHPYLKFLFISGFPQNAFLDVASDLDVDLLIKPFTQPELVAKLRELVEPVG